MSTFSKVVFIMTDTQRWDMCNCYRSTGLQTPCIDALAEKGMRFERGYTTQPVCQPARSAIFTGQYPSTCGSWSNSMGKADNLPTIGRRLADNGVHTAYIGKWHLDGGDYFGTGNCPDGWDENYWYDMRRYLEELTPQQRVQSRTTAYMEDNIWPEEMCYAHRCADKAEHFLANHGEESFFLTVSFDEPHGPYMCPPPYADMYKNFSFPKDPSFFDTLQNKPEYQQVWANGRQNEDKNALSTNHQYFFGCNSYVDYEIGRVLRAIETHTPDALIIYTSDHGDFLAAHSLTGKGPAAYDEITRIPYIIAGPGIPQGVNAHPVSHINLAPTIFDLMGFSSPKTFHGKSITPMLYNSNARVNDYIFMEFGRYEVDHDGFGAFQPMRSAFDGRYKLNIHLMSTDELYDLETDPYELDNLIHSPAHEAIRNTLHDAILQNQDSARDPFRGYYWQRRPWRTDAPPAGWEYTNMTRQREEDERYEKRQLDYDTGLPIEHAVRHKRLNKTVK